MGAIEPQYAQGLAMLLSFVGLLLSYFLVPLDVAIVATAIPKITDDFKNIGDVSWYGSAFLMTTGGFQSAWGKAYKFLPLKITYLVSILIFELGSLVCGVAPSSIALIIGRAIAGIGAAGMSCGVMTIIAVVFSPTKRPFFLGLLGVVYGVSSVIGPLLGGAITEGIGWRWCFYINLPIGGVAAAIVVFALTIPESARPPTITLKEMLLQVDPVGIVISMGIVITFTLALHYGGTSLPWGSSTVIGLLVGSIVMATAFAFWEKSQGERAAIPGRLMMDPNVLVNSMITACVAGSYVVALYYLPIYFQSVSGSSPIASGVKNLPLIISMASAILLSGVVPSLTGIAAPLIPIGSMFATVGAGLFYLLDVNTGASHWIGYQIIAGLGWGLAFQIPVIVAQARADASDISSVTAILLFFQTFGGSFSLAGAQAAFSNQLLNTISRTTPDVEPSLVLTTGATELRALFTSSQLSGILGAYVEGLKAVWVVGIAVAGLSFVFSLCSNWTRLNTGSGTAVAVA